MPKVALLDPHVADLIAAGEVVERPASVVKELMENSIDAGATKITVEIKNGGLTYMRVSDDGCGMSPDDAVLSFMRHATSKLRDARGLEAIGTLGFRGEALAAISSVARVEMLTREKGAGEGARVRMSGGVLEESAPAGCPEGTSITVEDLFYNTPARLKFMKSDRSEASGVSAAVLRCALSHPELSVRYIKDGSEEYHSPGDGKAESALYSLLGRDFSRGMVKARSEGERSSVRGYVSTPNQVHGNRNWQFFFVNGRYIKSRTLQAALEQAYRGSIPQGRFPGCVLYIEMSPALVDVNVHPAKTEVKFLHEKQVFDLIYYAARGALEGSMEPAEIKLSGGTLSAVAAPKSGAFRTMSAEEFRKSASGASARPVPAEKSPFGGGKAAGHSFGGGIQSEMPGFFRAERKASPFPLPRAFACSRSTVSGTFS